MTVLSFKKIILSFIMVIVCGFSNYSIAQMKAYDFSYETISNGDKLAIYIFCDSNNVGLGSLSFGTLSDPTYTYTWSKYDSSTSSFVDLSETSFKINNLKDGKYKVIAQRGADVLEEQAWVFNNTNSSSVDFTLDKNTCDGVFFNYKFTPWQIPINSASKPAVTKDAYKIELLKNNIVFKTSLFDSYEGQELHFFDDTAFENEASFSVRVSEYACLLLESEKIKASTSVIDPVFVYDAGPSEAPFEVNFSHSSNKIDTYEWLLYKEKQILKENEEDGLTEDDDNLIEGGTSILSDFKFIYLHPGEYKVKFIATTNVNSERCTYTYELEPDKYIKVDSSLVELPNVFTPNGDGINDEFCIKAKSLRSFKATVFNRWGRVMHTWTNEDDCWDGKVGGKIASAGTYFIVISAKGRENDNNSSYKKRTSFMLIK